MIIFSDLNILDLGCAYTKQAEHSFHPGKYRVILTSGVSANAIDVI